MKKKTGWLHVEQVRVSAYHFEEGENDKTDKDSGNYTRMWFEYANGQKTKEYTILNAPVWMLQFMNRAEGRFSC